MVIRGPAISTASCTLNGPNIMIVETSSLGPDFKLKPVYDDAADVGVTMKSHVSGKEVTFYMFEEIRSTDHELQGWQLKPIPEDVQKDRSLDGLMLIVFND